VLSSLLAFHSLRISLYKIELIHTFCESNKPFENQVTYLRFAPSIMPVTAGKTMTKTAR
jgi:hypothetical protein